MKYNNIASVILSIMLVLSYYLPHEKVTVIYGAIIIILLTLCIKKIDVKIVKHTFYLILLLILGIIVGYINNNFFTEHYIKDIYYLIKPLICIYLGYYIMSLIDDYMDLIKVVIYTGTILSVIRLIQFPFAYVSGELNGEIYSFRNIYGSGSILTVLSITFIHLVYRFKYKIFSNKMLFVMLLINMSSIFLSFARTYMVCIIISFILMGDFYKIKKIKNIWYLVVLFSVLSAIVVFNIIFVENSIFTEKILKTITELFIVNYNKIEDIHTLWRGYESYRGIATFIDSDILSKIIGGGYGSLIDLKLNMPLGDDIFRYISFTHNGYVYILLKHGLFGLFLYIMFFLKFIYVKKDEITSNRYFSSNHTLLINLSIQLLIITFVITGIFNKDILLPYLIIMGSLIHYHTNENKT